MRRKRHSTWLRKAVSLTLLGAVHWQSVLSFRLDRPAGVPQVAPRFFADRATYVLGKAGERLTGRVS